MEKIESRFLMNKYKKTRDECDYFTSNGFVDIEKGQNDLLVPYGYPYSRKHSIESFEVKFKGYQVRTNLQNIFSKQFMLGSSIFISLLSLYFCVYTTIICSSMSFKQSISLCTFHVDYLVVILFYSLVFGLIVASPLSLQFVLGNASISIYWLMKTSKVGVCALKF